VQETRLYDPDRDETRSMRSKEDAMDYRYFPDPDLLPLAISPEWIEQVRKSMPELPGAMRERFAREYGLSHYDAQTLTTNKGIASYFEGVARAIEDNKLAANWVIGEVSAAVNDEGISFESAKVNPEHLAEILRRVVDGTLNARGARELFSQMWTGKYRLKAEGGSYSASLGKIIAELGLEQISDAAAIEKIVDEILAANQKSVEEFRAGKEKAFNALVGQAMKATKGKANPQQVNDLLRQKLAG
jgi:aspartyl-tRNA(Asn)/glutamyl-tRNA(Gln) amidotransferase subunit B